MSKRVNGKLSIKAVAERWEKDARWLVETVNKLHSSPTGHGLKWTRSMILHYAKKYRELRKKTPRRCIALAKECDQAIQEIVEKYPAPIKG